MLRMHTRSRSFGCCFCWLLLAVWALHHQPADGPSLAYIGPGAGFAFLGSFLTLIGGALLGIASLLLWPFRLLWRSIANRKSYGRAKVRKVILLGLDGLDPQLLERFMAA